MSCSESKNLWCLPENISDIFLSRCGVNVALIGTYKTSATKFSFNPSVSEKI